MKQKVKTKKGGGTTHPTQQVTASHHIMAVAGRGIHSLRALLLVTEGWKQSLPEKVKAHFKTAQWSCGVSNV